MAELKGLTKETDYTHRQSTLKRSKSLNRKRITDIDMYLKYPYKTRHPLECMGRNSFPKSEISDHKYAVTLTQYKEILYATTDEMLNRIIQGDVVKLPYNAGYLFVAKVKKKKADIRFMTYYSLYFAWKKSYASFVNQKYWRLRVLQKTYTRLFEAVRKDSSLIHNYLYLNQNVRTLKYLDS